MGMSGCYRPTGEGSRQVLVYLHGHGNEPAWVPWQLRQHHDDGWVRVCPRAPHRVESGWSWFPTGPRGVPSDELAAATTAVAELVEATIADLGATWDDVVLGGFSQGAATALATAARLGADGRRVGGLLLQAAFVPETEAGDVDPATVLARSALVQHGRDDEVVPSWIGADVATMLNTGVDEVVHHEVDGGHVLDRPMLEASLRWLGVAAV